MQQITIQKGIYIVTNIINGKTYVGKAVNLHKRWYRHKYNAEKLKLNTYFYKAIRKHGIENFTIELIDEEYSNEREIFWISKLNPEYNMTKGGDGGWIYDQTGNRWKVKDTTNMKNSLKKSLDKRKVGFIRRYQIVITINAII